MALVCLGAATLGPVSFSEAQASEVSGEAFGHYTKVGLFGGPQGVNGPVPMVTLPPAGADPAITAKEAMGSAVYGPAHIFGGKWPADVSIAPPSGPVTVSTNGKAGPGGFVTSTADIALFEKPLPVGCNTDPPGVTNCTAPGGFGPVVPAEGDEVHSTCTANEQGATGSTRFVNGMLSTSTDMEGEPKDREPIPDNPPPNYTREGTITNVGDNWRIVFNEQIVDPDGSITVNAMHMFLLGQIAVGEQIVGHVRCSMNPAPPPVPGAPVAPTTSVTVPASTPPASEAAAPISATKPDDGNSTLPFVILGLVLAAGAALMMYRTRRRPATDGETPPG